MLILKSNQNDVIFPLHLVKQYAKISDDSDDDIVTLSISFAQNYAERTVGHLIGVRNYHINKSKGQKDILINVRPFHRVVAVRDKLGKSLAESHYSHERNSIIFDGCCMDMEYEIEIECGHSDYKQLEPDLQVAILAHASHHYNNRLNDTGFMVPDEVRLVYSKYKHFRII